MADEEKEGQASDVPSPEILEEARAEALASLDALVASLPATDAMGNLSPEQEMEKVVGRDVTSDDIAYLRKRFPYLQIVSTSASVAHHDQPKTHKSESGWTIVDYGNGLSSSPGEQLWQGVPEAATQEGATSPLMQQAFNTAKHMVALATQYHWPGIEIVSGTDIMKWSAWQHAVQCGLSVKGYEPDDKASKKFYRLFNMTL